MFLSVNNFSSTGKQWQQRCRFVMPQTTRELLHSLIFCPKHRKWFLNLISTIKVTQMHLNKCHGSALRRWLSFLFKLHTIKTSISKMFFSALHCSPLLKFKHLYFPSWKTTSTSQNTSDNNFFYSSVWADFVLFWLLGYENLYMSSMMEICQVSVSL